MYGSGSESSNESDGEQCISSHKYSLKQDSDAAIQVKNLKKQINVYY